MPWRHALGNAVRWDRKHWLRCYGWLLGVLVVASFAMLFRLGDRPIENWDEGIHGAVSFEMIEDGDWLTPHYAGGTYFRKPPLKLWMSALPFRTFGPNAWTLRLPSAASGIATALLVAWWMWKWRRSRLEAFLAGVIVATMRPIFFHAFRTGEMDGMLTLFVVAALYCWWRANSCVSQAANEIPNSKFSARGGSDARGASVLRRDASGGQIPNKSQNSKSQTTKWLAACGAAIGLAVMTKSAAGLHPIPIIVAHAMNTGVWRRFRFKEFLIFHSSFLIIVLPWHLAMTALHGMAFWNDYFGWHVIKRATEVLHNEPAGVWWWYFPTFARR